MAKFRTARRTRSRAVVAIENCTKQIILSRFGTLIVFLPKAGNLQLIFLIFYFYITQCCLFFITGRKLAARGVLNIILIIVYVIQMKAFTTFWWLLDPIFYTTCYSWFKLNGIDKSGSWKAWRRWWNFRWFLASSEAYCKKTKTELNYLWFIDRWIFANENIDMS